jgi:Mn-dependent DtxR family transcriptional regulator
MTEAIDALIATGDFDEDSATELLLKLHKIGYTIYRKKQFKNKRRPNVSQPLTPKLVAEIRDFFAENPHFTQQEIAHIFNVNIGRVNEALDQRK